MPFDPVLNCHRPVTEEDVELEFWRLVADIEETVEVEYGADIHCTTHGSGFPTAEKHPNDPYSTDPWNLNILPLHPDSLFRHIKTDISGMTVPWVYVGMIFSTFCWHNEDHYAYSANYQHFGSTKTWYGIPGEDAEKFEQANTLLEDAYKRDMLTEARELRALYIGYMNASRWDDSQKVIEAGVAKGVLQSGPDLARDYQVLAQNAYADDKIALAIDLYGKAAPMAADGEAYLNLAKVLDYSGKKAEAKAAAQKALDKGVKKPDEAKSILSR
jgi:hypothetical protein